MSILTAFSSISLSWVLHEYPNQVYASNLSCVQIGDLMTCEEQQNGLGSSDDSGSGVTDENEVDRTFTSSNENDETPLIIPSISPTLDDNDDVDGDVSSGQDNPEDGSDGAISKEGSGRALKDNENNDDLETALPSVLPFP
jgi:hypothetical protein